MKKLSLFVFAMTVAVGAAFAAPVDIASAKQYGTKYVHNTLGQKAAELTWVYTGVSEAGTDALYVFNFDHGYVVVAADDCAYPILGYCDNQAFDVNDIPEGLRYYLDYYARQIQYAIDNDLPVDQEIAEQWYLVAKEGVVMSAKSDKSVNPLLSTVWNQDWPYNMYAPTCSGGSYGHCYAGCVATAMSQNMKYWNWPETGNGEHSYSTSSYGGTLSVNFGATTYDWSVMTNSVNSNTPSAQAIALLMYHCGVAVDMNYSPSASGAYSDDVPEALVNYFRYGANVYIDSRDNYSKTAWEDMLIESFDRGLPVVYAGVDDNGQGGHAFNCCGYNNERKFYFNWGWSGSGNGYFEIDALNLPYYLGGDHFNTNQRAVFEMMPDYVYETMVPPIATLEVEVPDAMTRTVTVSFEVPTESASGANLESIERIELKRNGDLLRTFDNPQPGETISLEDQVEGYGYYEYTLCGVNNGIYGKSYSHVALVGPNCTWKLVGQTTNFQGWNNGKLQVIDENGVVFKEVTMTNSSPVSEKFQMPEGAFTLKWCEPLTVVPSMTISLKNSANQNVYSFTGASSQLNGIIFAGNNDCPSCTPPYGLTGEYHYEDGSFGTMLTWTCDYDPSNFKIYRSEDGEDYEEIAKIDNAAHEYFDMIGVGDYYYKVTAYSTACESTYAITPEGTDYVQVTVTSVDDAAAVRADIYPNPANSSLTIEATSINEVALYNLLGQPVSLQRASGDKVTLNTSGLDAGVYTIHVLTAQGTVNRRIVIMH